MLNIHLLVYTNKTSIYPILKYVVIWDEQKIVAVVVVQKKKRLKKTKKCDQTTKQKSKQTKLYYIACETF